LPLEAGQELLHYRLIEKIGEGGMGVVWKAHDTTLERDVAIKILPEELAADAGRLARFEREAKAVAALNHPNIITVYSVERDVRGLHFFTMELLSGTPLSRQIPKNGLSLDRFLDLALPLADAISAAHEQGITHRDLKPANVMVTTENRVKVLDFGLAKLLREASADGPEAPTRSMSLTQDGMLMGTIPYMSPEQVEGRAVDHRSDLFSLGVILYEMATGHHPFPGETHAAVMSAILRDTPASVTEQNPELPADLGRIVSHCLQKDPERRYQTAKGLRNELEELRKTSETGAVVPAPSSAARSASKTRAAWLVLATVVVLAVATSAYLWRRSAIASDPGVQRIVVLPFENLGPPDDAYFASGMTDEIHSRLALVGGLSVISRTSAMRYEGTKKTLQEIADELDVQYVLEGTVRWDRESEDRGRVRVTPRLVRVADDVQMWADGYDRQIEDVFAVQSEIAKQVIRELAVTLPDTTREAIDVRPTDNVEAYNAYLRGIDLSYPVNTPDADPELAAAMFERAVSLDPEFALAYAQLARVHGWMKQAERAASDLDRGEAAIREALRLGPDSADVHQNAGYYYYWGRRDYPSAVRHFNRAIALRPSDSYAYMGLGGALRGMGRLEEGLAAKQKAAQLDPRFAPIYTDIGDSYLAMRNYAEAERNYDRAIALTPDNGSLYELKAFTYWLWDGNNGRAREALEAHPGDPELPWFFHDFYQRDWQGALRRLSLSEVRSYPFSWFLGFLPRPLLECFSYHQMNDPERERDSCEASRVLLEKRLVSEPDNAILHGALGETYALLGRTDDAVREGRRAVDLRPLSEHALINTRHLLRLARIYATIGEQEPALDQLDQLLSIPAPVSVPMLRMDPIWDPLRDNPKFAELLDKYRP